MIHGRLASVVAVDTGPVRTSAWSPTGILVDEPSVVAVDQAGVASAYGEEAMAAVGRKTGALRLRRPFSDGAVRDTELARRYLRWIIERVSERRFRGTVLLPVHAATDLHEREQWRMLVQSLRLRPLVLERPLMAALGLGLDLDAPRAHMLVEIAGTAVELAVVVEGVVVASRLTRSQPDPLTEAAEMVHEMLACLDPDHELDIRDDGLHLHGSDLGRGAASLARRLDVAIAPLAPSASRSAVIRGARRVVHETLPYLTGV